MDALSHAGGPFGRRPSVPIAGEARMSDYLTVQEVAERMRCEHRTVRRAIRAGHLEAAMIGGRWLIRDDAVDAWFDSKRVAPQTPRRERSLAPRRHTTADPNRRGSVARLKAIEGSSGG